MSAIQSPDGTSGSGYVAEDVVPAIQQAAKHTHAMAHRGLDAVQNTSRQLRGQASHANAAAQEYIRQQPVKSVLIAAAAGAALAGVVSLTRRAHAKS